MSLWTSSEEQKFVSSSLLEIINNMNTHGVNAPGTANKITFLLAVKSAMLILLAGESSNKSIDGIFSPSWKNNEIDVKTALIH